MNINYSTIDTIEEYNIIFKNFYINNKNYEVLDKSNKLIFWTAGLALSNSIHERFIKSMIEEYIKIYELSNTKKKNVIDNYKTPRNLKGFVELLNLDLNEAFELMKSEIQEKFKIIDSIDSLLAIIDDQRNTRNDYLHGDFNFEDEILFDNFRENIIEFQQIHNFTLKITRYSFMKRINELPNI